MSPTVTLFLVLLAFLCGAGTAWRVWWELRRARRLNDKLEQLGSSLGDLAAEAELLREHAVSAEPSASVGTSREVVVVNETPRAVIPFRMDMPASLAVEHVAISQFRATRTYRFFVDSSFAASDAAETYADLFGHDIDLALEHAGKVGVVPVESVDALKSWMERTPATSSKSPRRDRTRGLLLTYSLWREEIETTLVRSDEDVETGPVPRLGH